MINHCLFSKMLVNDLLSFDSEAKPVIDGVVRDADLIWTKVKSDINTESTNFVSVVKKSTTKLLTTEVNKLDKDRDTVEKSFINYVGSFTSSLDKAEAAAATRIMYEIEASGRMFYRKSMAVQTVLVKSLIYRLETSYADDLDLLDCGKWIERIKKQEDLFNEKYEQRKNFIDNMPNSSASELSPLLILAYEHAFNYINTMCDLMKDADFIAATTSLNNIIIKYNAIIKGRITRNSKKTEEETANN